MQVCSITCRDLGDRIEMKVLVYYQKFNKAETSSHALLNAAVRRYVEETGSKSKVQKAALTVERDSKFGKPYCKELPEVHFSISHSGAWWSCACAPQEVGLDLQQTQAKNLEKLAKRFFHPQELLWLRGKESSQFYRLWTYKESYVKYTGTGLLAGLDSFSVVSGETTRLGAEGVFQQELSFPDSDFWMVLTAKTRAQPILRILL